MKDLIDAGYIRENLDGSIDIAKAEENQPFDPMKMDNENWGDCFENQSAKFVQFLLVLYKGTI